MPKFSTSRLSYETTACFDQLPVKYLDKYPFLQKFYGYEPGLNGIVQKLKSYQNDKLDRKTLVSVLKSQYSADGIEMSPKLASNVESLLDNNCFTVTTGHQLNFFSGPLYVLFKLISTIKLADELTKKFVGKTIVPVYWMATEDHDIDEINHINLFGKTLRYNSEFKGPAGQLPLNNINILLAELDEVIGTGVHADELRNAIKSSFGSSTTLSSAIRKWTNHYLGNSGLIILDANHPLLKKSFIDVMENELNNQSSFALVNQTKAELSSEFSTQVNPREINLFYMDGKSRNRIVSSPDGFEILNTELKFDKKSLLEKLHESPESFSPNVILRPMYQEVILPNLAYVGGPAEVAYWLELKSVFDFHYVSFPVILLRNCAMIIDLSTGQKISKLHLKPNDFFSREDDLIRNYISAKEGSQFNIEAQAITIAESFDLIRDNVNSVDASLRASVESEKQRALNALKALEEKVMRSLKKKDENELIQIKKIREKLFPGGVLQERVESFLPLYLKWGSELFDVLYREFDPLNNQFSVIVEEGS